MKRSLLTVLLLTFIIPITFSQSPGINWAYTFGGANNDEAYDIIQTTDGGFAICGMTESKGMGGKDAWIIKLDPNGKLEWEHTYGDKKDEVANAIIQTSDNGYAFIGYTNSKGKGKKDVWFMKLDSQGNKMWETTYGGPKDDIGNDLIETMDGNYVFLASSKSYGAGNFDLWAMKIDTKGKRIWKRVEGGKGADIGVSVAENKLDSGIVLCGTTFSYATGVSDLWLIRLTPLGRRDWRKSYGSINKDQINHMLLKSTGEYIMTGTTQPKGERYDDLWIVGFTPESWDDWEYTETTPKDEGLTCSSETTDGGVIACGYTTSVGEGSYDFLLLKFDKTGKKLWQDTYGGPDDDRAMALVATGSNEAVVCGFTRSDGEGKRDIWVISLK